MNPALVAAYESAKARMPGVSLRQFAEILNDASLVPVENKGQVIGAIVTLGDEMHACVPESVRGSWLKRKHLALLQETIERFGQVRTTATTDCGKAFVERLGFVFDPDTEYWIKRA